jgi:DNA replication protein DnaC
VTPEQRAKAREHMRARYASLTEEERRAENRRKQAQRGNAKARRVYEFEQWQIDVAERVAQNELQRMAQHD